MTTLECRRHHYTAGWSALRNGVDHLTGHVYVANKRFDWFVCKVGCDSASEPATVASAATVKTFITLLIITGLPCKFYDSL